MERRDLYADTAQGRAWDAPDAFSLDRRELTPEEVVTLREEAEARLALERKQSAARVREAIGKMEVLFGYKKGA